MSEYAKNKNGAGFNFGNMRKTSNKINDLDMRSVDNYGNYITTDNFNNVRLVRDGRDASFDYQKKYNIIKDENGAAFVSVMDNEVVNNIVEGWANPTSRMLEMRRGMVDPDNENDTGDWKAPTSKVASMLSDWRNTYTSIASGNDVGSYIDSGMKKTANTSYENIETTYSKPKFRVEETKVKKGMTVSCSNCGKSGITMEMNFCPYCGYEFTE